MIKRLLNELPGFGIETARKHQNVNHRKKTQPKIEKRSKYLLPTFVIAFWSSWQTFRSGSPSEIFRLHAHLEIWVDSARFPSGCHQLVHQKGVLPPTSIRMPWIIISRFGKSRTQTSAFHFPALFDLSVRSLPSKCGLVFLPKVLETLDGNFGNFKINAKSMSCLPIQIQLVVYGQQWSFSNSYTQSD